MMAWLAGRRPFYWEDAFVTLTMAAAFVLLVAGLVEGLGW